MPKNTFILLIILSVFTALVIGVNIGQRISRTADKPLPMPTIPVVREPSPTPTPKLTGLVSAECGVTFNYPEYLTKLESPQGGMMLVDTKNPAQSIALACQKDIPRPALKSDLIEDINIGSVSAKLYHDSSAKDGAPIEKLIFTHPIKKIDIFISGTGFNFESAVRSLNILR